MGIMTEPDWSLIGSVLARSDAEKQIEFFRAFAAEVQTFGTMYQTGFQLAAINHGLNEQERDIISQIIDREDGE